MYVCLFVCGYMPVGGCSQKSEFGVSLELEIKVAMNHITLVEELNSSSLIEHHVLLTIPQ